jgi:hypothetical protein
VIYGNIDLQKYNLFTIKEGMSAAMRGEIIGSEHREKTAFLPSKKTILTYFGGQNWRLSFPFHGLTVARPHKHPQTHVQG